MNWRVKAAVQKIVACFPAAISYRVYYFLQRRFGSMRGFNPRGAFSEAVDLCCQIERIGGSVIGSSFLEVGTGRRILMPISFWLMGASRILTVDLNPYLKEELVQDDINFICFHEKEIKEIFGEKLFRNRLQELLSFVVKKWKLKDLLDFCCIEYLSPSDAAKLKVDACSFDFHISKDVLEHVPPGQIIAVLKEGARILKNEGMSIHRVDYADHFSYSDRKISAINFLQFDDGEWDRIAGNKYMYMNRLRLDDYLKMFQDIGLCIVRLDSVKDLSLAKLLRSGKFCLADRFHGKTEESLVTTSSWIFSKKAADT